MNATPTVEERFRSLLRLQASEPEKTPIIMRGTLHPFRLLEGAEGPALRWYERMLPNKFRLCFALFKGLEAHAAQRAAGVPPEERSPEWERLLAWQARYPTLDVERKAALLMLNNKLCLNADNERLLAGDAPPPAGRWSEAQTHYAYQRAFNPFMTREVEMKDGPKAFVEVFDRAPAGTRIKFMSSNKFIVLSFELKCVTADTYRALEVMRSATAELRENLSACEAKVWESKFWRAATYFPDKAKDDAELRRQMESLEATAMEAVALAAKDGETDAFLPHFAAENLHGACATLGIIHMHHKRHAQALAYYRRMIELDPLGFWQKIAVGRMLFELGRFDEALPELERGFELAVVGRDDVCDWLARCCEKLGRPGDAARWREAGVELAAKIEAARARANAGDAAGARS